jgi:FlaA1/EpsC-like NDP-sugar epimerase
MGKPVKIIDLARKMIKLADLSRWDIMIKIVDCDREKINEELLNDTSKKIPTYHDKIMIAEEIQDEYEIHADIEEL